MSRDRGEEDNQKELRMKLYFLFPIVCMVFTITVRERNNVSLPCVMEQTVWSHNNRVILYVQGGEIFKSSKVNIEVAENGTHLIIQNAKLEDAGVSKKNL